MGRPSSHVVTRESDWNPLFKALLAGDASEARRLLASDCASRLLHIGPGNLNTLHAAVLGSCDPSVLSELVAAGGSALLSAEVQARDQAFLAGVVPQKWRAARLCSYDTPLQYAAKVCDVPPMRELLQLGADPNAGRNEEYPLCLVVRGGVKGKPARGEAAALLLERGADCLQHVKWRDLVLNCVSKTADVAAACLAHLDRQRTAGKLQLGGTREAVGVLRCALQHGHIRLVRHSTRCLEGFYSPARGSPASSTDLVEIMDAAINGSTAQQAVTLLLRSSLPFDLSKRGHWSPSYLGWAAAECPELVPLMLRAGARVEAEDVLRAVRAPTPDVLAALAACGPLPVDTRQPGRFMDGERVYTCPVHCALARYSGRSFGKEASQRQPLRILELLLEAGLRPTVWRNVQPPPFLALPGTYPMAVLDPFEYHSRALPSRLVFVARGGTWSLDTHRCWPRAFKAAARTLLLAVHRGSRVENQGRGQCRLGSLPNEVMLLILGQAAMPMSAWLPEA